MSAVDGTAAADAPHSCTHSIHVEVLRILLGSETSVASACRLFSGGRPLPFHGQELREALAIIDALSRVSEQSVFGAGGARPGDGRQYGGSTTQRFVPHTGQQTPFAPLEHARERDPLSLLPRDLSRTIFGGTPLVRDVSRIEHLKERVDRALETGDPKTIDRPGTPTTERSVTSAERALKGEHPTIVSAHPSPAREAPQSSDEVRPHENNHSRKERDPSVLITAAIQAILNDSRNDTARIVTQTLVIEPQLRQTTETTPSLETRATTFSTSYESRERLQEKLSHIRDALQSALELSSPVATYTDRTSAAAPFSTAASTPGDFTRVDVPHRNLPPITTIATEGRNATDRSILDPVALPAKGAAPIRTDAGGRLSTTTDTHTAAGLQPLRGAGIGNSTGVVVPLEKGITLVDALSKSTQQVFNLGLLHKLERALDTVAITGAATVVLGALGIEAMIMRLTALSKELLAHLREADTPATELKNEHKSIEEMIRDLEAICRDRGIENTEQSAGLVADITGVITASSHGLPIEGVIVDAGHLGTTVTDTFGEFKIANVALNTGFSLTCYDHRYSFFPNPIVGTVSTGNHFSIHATKLDE